MRESLGLNKEVKFLFEHKFPVNHKDESILSVSKILLNFNLYLRGDYVPQEEIIPSSEVLKVELPIIIPQKPPAVIL